MKYLFVSWEDIERLTVKVALAIRERGFEPDIIVGVSRGGLAPTRILSDFLDVHDVIILGVAFYEEIGRTGNEPVITHPLSLGIRGKKVVLLDDVSDTGGSLALAKKHVQSLAPSELLVCTLHRKPWSTCDPDIYIEETDRWIIYAWEKVEAAEHIRENLGAGDNYRQALEDAGFSDGDVELLDLLGINLP
jgi:hypoxanthine phosphoribosyltransferase